MTVLKEEVGECCPPRKRLCLSVNRNKQLSQLGVDESKSSSDAQTSMAMPIEPGLMGVGVDGGASGGNSGDSESPITSLSNLGNTCFLNSVLYTLRFAPSFMHNLHHLALDLREFTSKTSIKCSSLGRGSKSWSTKDLPSLSGGDINSVKMQIATDKLHQLYEALHTEEIKDRMEPYHAHIFLHSLRDVNPIFEGNQQHDAHELLVCLLDNIRETCQQLKSMVEGSSGGAIITQPPPPQPRPSIVKNVKNSLNITLSKNKNKLNGTDPTPHSKNPSDVNNAVENGDWCTNGTDGEDENSAIGHNFISEYFEGVSLLRTTCLECEQVTLRKETFCDICVPITTDPHLKTDEPLNVNKLYQNALITEELLRDSNKYWCEQCMRYNEAKRCVRFQSLPKLLTLQIKRFSSGYGSVVSKVNEHMPTPLELGCFCEECEGGDARHNYHLYSVIMHLGATMASGHYVAYVRARDSTQDYLACSRQRHKAASLQPNHKTQSVAPPPEKPKKKTFWNRLKNNGSNNTSASDTRSNQYFRASTCRGLDCCGVRLRCDDSTESVWLECDDESVRTISRRQLEDILAQKQPKNCALTPYLLFYARQ